MTGRIKLRSGEAEAEVSASGAELLAWRVGGEALLWRADPAIWAETAPLLFPVVGWTRGGQARVGGKTYPLGLHGFARGCRFRVAALSNDFARLILEDNAKTQALYPFRFRLTVDYGLDGPTLNTTLTVENRSDDDMPYACGLHPGFVWPLPGCDAAGHHILFEAEEAPEVPVITEAGLFSAQRRAIPLEQGRKLDLSSELLAQEALCFLDTNSRSLTYDGGRASLRIETEDFNHFALWSRPKAPFLSIECWTGHGDPEEFDGDLFEKPSMIRLLPGTSKSHKAVFTFRRKT